MRKAGKIASVLFLIVMVGVIFYLAFDVGNEKPYEITLVELNGCNYLPTENYFKYAELDRKEIYPELTLPVLKSRFEKHPYVKRADVIYKGNGKVEIDLTEKSFKAQLFTNDKKYIVTEDFELLPILKYTQRLVLPIITTGRNSRYTMFQYVKKNKELVPAFETLDAIKIINPQLYDNLSEIVLKDTGDMELYFAFTDYPVRIEKGKEIEDVYYYNKLWEYLAGSKLNNNIKYIDLRYSGKIFLGLDESNVEGNKS